MFARIKNFFLQERAMRMARGFREGHRYAASALLNGMPPAAILQNLAGHNPDVEDDYFESLVRGAEQAIHQYRGIIGGRPAL